MRKCIVSYVSYMLVYLRYLFVFSLMALCPWGMDVYASAAAESPGEPMAFVIYGPSSSGKSNLVAKLLVILQESFPDDHWIAVAVDDLKLKSAKSAQSPLGNLSSRRGSNADYLLEAVDALRMNDRLANESVLPNLHSGQTVIIDTVFENKLQLESFRNIVNADGFKVFFISLIVDPGTLVERCKARMDEGRRSANSLLQLAGSLTPVSYGSLPGSDEQSPPPVRLSRGISASSLVEFFILPDNENDRNRQEGRRSMSVGSPGGPIIAQLIGLSAAEIQQATSESSPQDKRFASRLDAMFDADKPERGSVAGEDGDVIKLYEPAIPCDLMVDNSVDDDPTPVTSVLEFIKSKKMQ
ncbi:MAG: AAA family ATPase [Oligoflexia bacterium]|nr:AAA family ATPase [Oligoflexia bacterium]